MSRVSSASRRLGSTVRDNRFGGARAATNVPALPTQSTSQRNVMRTDLAFC